MKILEITCLLEDPLNAMPRAIDEVRRGGHRLLDLAVSPTENGFYEMRLVAGLNGHASDEAFKAKLLGILHLTGRAHSTAYNNLPREVSQCTKSATF